MLYNNNFPADDKYYFRFDAMPTLDEELIGLRKEDEIILCCARSKLSPKLASKLKVLLREDVDWQYLINKASECGVRQLLYVNLIAVVKNAIPANILKNFSCEVKTNALRSMRLFAELFKIMALFRHAQIAAIPYKGPLLAFLAYNDVSLREFSDLDIFVAKKDMIKAKNYLLAKGYKGRIDYSRIDDSFYINTEYSYIFDDKKTGVALDIQWKPWGYFITLPRVAASLSDRFTTVEIAGAELASFAKENLFLILVLHAAKHFWSSLSWLCDISEFMHNQKIDWNEVQQKADALGIKRMLSISLYLVQRLLVASVPRQISSLIDSDKIAKKVAHKIIKNLFSPTGQNASYNWRMLFLPLLLRENLFYGLNDFLRYLTMPTSQEFATFPLPKLLYPCYFVIRPVYLLWRKALVRLFRSSAHVPSGIQKRADDRKRDI